MDSGEIVPGNAGLNTNRSDLSITRPLDRFLDAQSLFFG